MKNFVLEPNRIVDFGTVIYKLSKPGNVGNTVKTNHVAAMNRCLSDKVYHVLSEGYKCITLGGDHSLAVGKWI